jgi:hypothetical protein
MLRTTKKKNKNGGARGMAFVPPKSERESERG